MILKALTLENFKGIREPVRIEFAPLTLLFGPNNAGKSTIVQALMYAREVLERNNCDAGRTVLGGDTLDLGGFKNLVHGHDLNRVIRMRFELDLRQGSQWREADSEREDELIYRVCEFYEDAPKKLDVQSARRLRERLVDAWVQIEIAWSKEAERPLVRSYSVGTGVEAYARITYDAATGEASLSYFNFGMYPFGTSYTKGTATDFEWEFAKQVRKFVRQSVGRDDWSEFGIKEGAQVGMAGEVVEESENRPPRHLFDEIVSQIIAGDGDWGDSTVDEETREHNQQFAIRKSLIDYAQSRHVFAAKPHLPLGLKSIVRHTGKAPSAPRAYASNASESEEKPKHLSDLGNEAGSSASDGAASKEQPADKKKPCWNDWQSFMDHLFDGQDDEIDSWILEFFVALIEEDYIEADFSIPLRQGDSALPKWGRALELGSRIWTREDCSEFWEFPQFAQEFFKDVLTVAIVNPGQELLWALKQAVYLSPFRRLPSRAYRTEKQPEPRSWASGLGAWDLLSLGSEDPLRDSVSEWLTSPERFKTKYRVIAQRRKNLDVGGEFWNSLIAGDIQTGSEELSEKLKSLPEDSKLELQDIESGLLLAPQDLGVGISQVIPVIVAALHNPSGQESRMVMIEEPESNIHPAFQVVLADLFISQAKANPNVLFLIETHSEHLILRIMRRMRETFRGKRPGGLTLTPKGVSVLYVERDADRTVVRSMPLNEAGELVKAWPGGFFEEGLKEQFGDD